jgi:hypothetical protein
VFTFRVVPDICKFAPNDICVAAVVELDDPISCDGVPKFASLDTEIARGATVGEEAEEPKRSPVNLIVPNTVDVA